MENPQRRQFTRIKGLSEIRRLPRLGKIRLGIKVQNDAGVEYPQETDYFVCPPEVQEVYGEKPKELEIMFPVNEIDLIFPQRLAWFGSSKGVKCMGDGEIALRYEGLDGQHYKDGKEILCPCDLLDHGCSRRASLLIMLPKVNMGGVYQIDISSYHSIVDLNSVLSTDPDNMGYIMALIGRIAMIPLKLKRIPRETHGSGRKETHYTLNIFFEGNIDFVNQLRESSKVLALPQYDIPEAELESPGFDDVPTEEEQKEAFKDRGMIPEVGIDSYREGLAPEKTKVGNPTLRVEETRSQEEKINDAKILNEVAKVITKVTNERELFKWFNEFKKTRGLSTTIISESTILVNEKIQKFREAGQR